MQTRSTALFVALLLAPSLARAAGSPLAGRWDFTTTTPGSVGANWLGITEKAGGLEVWFQPSGGHVIQLKDFEVNGSHLTLHVAEASGNRPATTWELDAVDGKLTGVQKRGDKTLALTGFRAPDLKHPEPKSWTSPEPIFNGKNLDGWEPIGNPANSHWVVKDGLLVNEEHGANLKTTRNFGDFRLHFDVNCPDRANSGVYLRGRYEVQLEYEAAGTEPVEREMGSVYGRLGPQVQLPRKPGEWETFDITLVGRTVTIVRSGV
ncbi:MAG: DUF1080 domain-containing protein, partial [Acidobacteriota bacterium]